MKKTGVEITHSSRYVTAPYLVARYTMAVLLACIIFLIPQAAHAEDVGAAVCMIADGFAGEVAAGIATIAVCTVGAMACIGRVQWSTALVVATGIAILFGAGSLVKSFGGTPCICYEVPGTAGCPGAGGR